MSSLYDVLIAKLEKDPRLTKRGGPRVDLSLLLFNAKESLNGLWTAADRFLQSSDADALDELRDAVEKLRPLFGERRES